MTSKYYRCCYTNDTWQQDGRLASGWRTVAASPDLPQQARDTCGWMQSSVVPTRPVNLDEDGNPLNLLEMAGDGQFFYLIRTQYGLQDREGRANIFSHGYIFPAESSLMENPAVLLTAAGRENFGQSIAEAEAKTPNFTGSLPALAEARMRCGLDEKRYLTLIRCVYLQMTQRQALWPLYIQCRDEEEMKALLCCIYAALPRYLRGRLYVSSAEMEKRGRNLIFVRSVAEKNHWLIPATGENDLLTPRVIQRLERLEFVDYPVICQQDQERADYFDRLEAEADRLTVGLAALAPNDSRQEMVHKIAHQIICDGNARTGEELEIRLADALRAPQTDRLDLYLAGLLKQYSGLGLFLTPEAEEELAARVQNTRLHMLVDQMDAYDRRRLLTLPPEEGAKVLALRDEAAVEKLRPLLLADARGTEILDQYEANALGDSPDWKTLWRGVQTVSTVPLPVTRARIEALAWQRYEKELAPGTARQTFEDYMALVSRLNPDTAAQLGDRARLRYWQDFSLTYASPEHLSEMNFFVMDEDRRCQVARAFAALPIFREKKGVRQFLRALCSFYANYRADLSRMDGETAIGQLRQQMEQAAQENDLLNRYIGHWMALAVRLSPEELDSLLELVEAASKGETASFIRNAASLLEVVNRQASGEITWLRGLLSRLWQQQERTGDAVPLDVWLSLAVPGENPFLSLASLQPRVLELPPKEVAAASRLLFLPQIRQYAEEYQRGGELARTVKQWMNTVRQMEKKGLAPAVLDEEPKMPPVHEADSSRGQQDRFSSVLEILRHQEPAEKSGVDTGDRAGSAFEPSSRQEPAVKSSFEGQDSLDSVFELLRRRSEESKAVPAQPPEPSPALEEPAGQGGQKDEWASLYASMDRFLGKEVPDSETPAPKQEPEKSWQSTASGRMTSGASVRPLEPLRQEKEKQPEQGSFGSSPSDANYSSGFASEKGRSGATIPDVPLQGSTGTVRSGASVRPQDIPPQGNTDKQEPSRGFSGYQPTPPRYFDQEFDTLRSGASVRPSETAGVHGAESPLTENTPLQDHSGGIHSEHSEKGQTEPADAPSQEGPASQVSSLLDRLRGFFKK